MSNMSKIQVCPECSSSLYFYPKNISNSYKSIRNVIFNRSDVQAPSRCKTGIKYNISHNLEMCALAISDKTVTI